MAFCWQLSSRAKSSAENVDSIDSDEGETIHTNESIFSFSTKSV
jgi:hypothetical protein